jgi:CIC family chloride channel protein
LPWFALLGILSGLLGAGFLKMLRYSEERFKLLPIPVFAGLALGGLVVGAISVAFPEVWGNGYSVTNQMLRREELALEFLVGVFFAKLLATLATVGSGAVGGVFSPTLFLGAALGSAFVAVLHQTGLARGLPTGDVCVGWDGQRAAATTIRRYWR